jgi:hypothetical protein
MICSFKYGFRINPDIVKDEQGSSINQPQVMKARKAVPTLQDFNWKFAPLVYPQMKCTKRTKDTDPRHGTK